MTLIRHRQPAITRVNPHNANKKYLKTAGTGENVPVVNISQASGCSCDYEAPAEGCINNCTYTATPLNFTNPPDTWLWAVAGDTAIIFSGQGTDSIVVQTDNSDDELVNVTVTATDSVSGDTAEKTQQFTQSHNDITIPADPPLFTGTILTMNEVNGAAMTPYDASAHYVTGGAVDTYGLTSAPLWMSIDPLTGIITGTPDVTSDTLNVFVTGTNADGAADSNFFTVSVVDSIDAPIFDGTINDFSEISGTGMTPYDASAHFTTGGAVATYLLNGNEPTWFVIDPNTGIITGMPSGVQANIDIRVIGTNAGGNDASNLFVVTVAPALPIFDGNIANFNEVNGVAMTPYEAAQHFITGGPVATYTLQDGPTWMLIDPNTGQITGTPDAVAVTNLVTVKGTNPTGSDTSNTFDVTVTAALAAPIFDGTIANFTETNGQAMTPYDASTHFTTGGAVATYTLNGAPTWMSIHATTGVISGTPDAVANTAGITVTGTNATGNDSSNAFAVDVQAAAGTTDFVSVWRTTAAAETITLPLSTGTYNMLVKWGDGSEDTITSSTDPLRIHEYAIAGDYTVTISGICARFKFAAGGDRLKILKVTNLGEVGWTEFDAAFDGCDNLTEVTAGNCDTSSVSTMFRAFRNCIGLVTIDLTGMNTVQVETMQAAFLNVAGDPNIQVFNMFAVINAASMMSGSGFGNANYDATLLAYSVQTLQPGIDFHAGTAQYTEAAARLILTDPPNNWIITDGGAA